MLTRPLDRKWLVPLAGLCALAVASACSGGGSRTGGVNAASSDPTAKTLSVALSGSGSGGVTSTSAPTDATQISCGAITGGGKVCGAAFLPATVVTLTAVPATGSTQTWYGDCAPAGGDVHAATCVVTMSDAKSVRVAFDVAGKVPGVTNASYSSIAVSPASVPADGANTSTITMTLRDFDNTALTGKTIALSLTAGTGTLSTAAEVGGGVYTATIKSGTAETDTIQATVDGVSLTTSVIFTAIGTVTGTVVSLDGSTGTDVVVAGATVKAIVNGIVSAQGAVTDASGNFSLKASPGPIFLRVEPPTGSSKLKAETRSATFVTAGVTTALSTAIELADPPTTGAVYSGTEACTTCHATEYNKLHGISAMSRSLTIIHRDAQGRANAGEFTRMVNKTLTSARKVMVPIANGNIAIDVNVSTTAVTGTSTTFTTDLVPGDQIVYSPVGLGQYTIGTVASITDDTHLTLTAAAALAPQVTSITAQRYGKASASRSYTHEMPEDFNDIVAPNWPGVKATSPNSDPNSAGGGSQVNVYFCNLKNGTFTLNGASVTFTNDEYVQKFGGSSYTCTDGAFYDGVTAPAVPLVRIQVIYGGQGDTDGAGTQGNKPNMGVFKQRYQGVMRDIKYAYDNWKPGTAHGYTSQADFDRDTLTLPIQLLHSGDLQTGDGWLMGAYKLNGYHPTEQKFPGESWSQRTRTFSHACAGCHNTGLRIDFDVVTQALPFSRDDGNTSMTLAAVKSYSWANGSSDENFNIGCEHCHGPGSQHVALSLAAKNGGSIVNPKYLTADAERQACGKCHAYDDAADGRVNVGGTFVEQTYGFEAAWNSENMAALGFGNFIPGVYDLFGDAPGSFIGNWEERLGDGEAGWNPNYTPENRFSNVEGAGEAGKNVFLGQAHRQQYAMIQYSAHANNAYEQLTCSSCHDSHSTYLANTTHGGSAAEGYATFVYNEADYRNNVSCLGCHAGFGDFAAVDHDMVAAVHANGGGAHAGTVTKGGLPYTPSASYSSAVGTIATAVTGHMTTRAGMMLHSTTYNPTADTTVAGNTSGASYTVNSAKIVTNGPIGRCTSCHMPKVAKSGGYFNNADSSGNLALVESDQASHTFDPIMPSATPPLGSGGPTWQSGSYNYKGYVLPGGKTLSDPSYNAADAKVAARYDYYGFMPNSCGKCHLGARRASLVVPDQSGLYPGKGAPANAVPNSEEGCGGTGEPACTSYWPLSEHLYDTSSTATDPSDLKKCYQGTTPVFCTMVNVTGDSRGAKGTLVPLQPLPVP